MLPLKIALGNYGLTRPLKEGAVRSERIAPDYVVAEPITIAGMRPMVRELAFDVCEMAFTTYLCARAAGKKITAIPVFLTRNFHHWAAFVNSEAGIRTPKDLEGRMVGVNRGYTVTTGLWVRGILQHEYGVDLEKITWAPTDEEHVAEFVPPRNVDHRYVGGKIVDLLVSGTLPAGIGDIRTDSPAVRPLIHDAREAGYAYFRKTGIYPVNHGVVVKDQLLADHPWLAEELFRMFAAAKELNRVRLAGGIGLSAADQNSLALARVVGDPFPFGLAANRKALETMLGFAVEQHLLPARVSPESLFAPSTLSLGA